MIISYFVELGDIYIYIAKLYIKISELENIVPKSE